MAKQLTGQRYIFKIHSARLRRAKWKLELSISEARDNDEVVALSDQQTGRLSRRRG